MATRRQERINHQMVQVISELLRELKDDRIGFVTVTKADVTPDLRYAKIYVSVLGDDEVVEKTMTALQGAAGHVQHHLGGRLVFKYTPRIEFHLDKNIANADEMEQLIKEARASDPNLAEEE